ncbi:hypothetical protein [Corynebacterium sanguinis]|uniref:hypothetical protein n=1 Tax=Corynebacterium sanguinis TaxID=2594913 RepID=UPI0010A9A8F1|nr:hypothetical protein [Corynebacterium sanguinis]MCT1444311.1 hypothetical protein [Corynebacterium sanguinis]MCT1694454.1 hypothetical protein [Corynebacterium sanguinis]MCT1713863.1 hypothetical protein [Corynebacterium sanguinis]
MKKAIVIVSAFFTCMALSACGSGVQEQPTPTSQTASSSTPTTTSTNTTTAADTQCAVAEQPESHKETYVVECLAGVPGPAQWSDGTTKFSQDCYDQGVANRGDYQCQGTDYFVDDPSECAPRIKDGVPLDQIPIADGGTCPAYKCGYGHEANGNPNPTSGELQTMDGCSQGYITDQALCGAVAQKAEQYGW